MIEIVELSKLNYIAIAELAYKLWPDSSLNDEKSFFKNCIGSKTKTAFLLKFNSVDAGFVFVSIRTDYVEGTRGSKVCYVEGIYIEPSFRRRKYGELLIKKAEEWGKQMSCTEIASDTEIENEISIGFHKSAGFKEVNRIVCFAKKIFK